MNKILKTFFYIISIMTCGYLIFLSFIFIFLQLQGVKLVFLYEAGVIAEVTIIPQILQFCFILTFTIYLIINGLKWVKINDK